MTDLLPLRSSSTEKAECVPARFRTTSAFCGEHGEHLGQNRVKPNPQATVLIRLLNGYLGTAKRLAQIA